MSRLHARKGAAGCRVWSICGHTPPRPPDWVLRLLRWPPSPGKPVATSRRPEAGFMAAAKKAVLGPLVGAVDQGTSSTRFLVSPGVTFKELSRRGSPGMPALVIASPSRGSRPLGKGRRPRPPKQDLPRCSCPTRTWGTSASRDPGGRTEQPRPRWWSRVTS